MIDKLKKYCNYDFRIWNFEVSHSKLTLRGTLPEKDEHNVHLNFYGVGYIEMNTFISNVDFRNPTEKESERIKSMLKEQYDEGVNHIVLVANNGIFHIICEVFDILENVEPVYKTHNTLKDLKELSRQFKKKRL